MPGRVNVKLWLAPLPEEGVTVGAEAVTVQEPTCVQEPAIQLEL